MRIALFAVALASLMLAGNLLAAEPYQLDDSPERILLKTPQLEAVINKKGYVTGVKAQTFLDVKTGFRDAGYGLDIVDWIMEPGSDEAYRDQLVGEMVYKFGNDYHGQTPKRSIEGPQICTQAKELSPSVIRGKDFVAVQQSYQYRTAAPGKNVGSTWTQKLVFPLGKRYFISSDRIDAVNDSPAMFLRLDMPGHIKHNQGDSFSEIFLSYHGENGGRISSKEFLKNFAPDERFNYRRERLEKGGQKLPQRIIRGYHLRDPKTGQAGPWLLGMTLNPASVSEGWCHQRGYVCLIEEFGERPIKAGEHFSAAFIVGFFDSLEEAEKVYDHHQGANEVEVSEAGWKLVQ